MKRARKSIQKPEDLKTIIKENKNFKEFYGTEIYTEYKDLFTDTNPTYYRKDSGDVQDFIYKTKNPVIIFLKPDIYRESQFIDYLGINVDHFFKIMEDETPGIIPFCDRPKSYINPKTGNYNPFYARFFYEWLKNTELDEKPPLYGNAFESALLSSFSSEDELFRTHTERIEKMFPNLRDKKVQPNINLNPQKFGDYFGERLARLEMLNLKPISENIMDLLINCNKTKKQVDLNMVSEFMFYCHQMFSVPIFYSKGSVLTLSIDDYNNIKPNLEKLAQNMSKSLQINEHMKNKVSRLFPYLQGHLSCEIAKKKDRLRILLTEDIGHREKLKIWQKIQNNETIYEQRSECQKYENELVKFQSDFVSTYHGNDKVIEARDALHECMEIVRDSYLDSLSKYCKLIPSSCEIMSALPLKQYFNIFLDNFEIEPVDDISGHLINPAIHQLKSKYESHSFKRQLDIISESIIFRGTSVSIWEKGADVGCEKDLKNV